MEEDERTILHRSMVRLEDWYRAVEMQHERAIGPIVGSPADGVPEEVYREEWYRRQRDVDQYVVALELMVRAVKLAMRVPEAEAALMPALHDFNEAAPFTKGLRDALMHFDDYDLGKGKRTPTGSVGSPSHFYGETDAGLNYDDMQMYVSQSTPAARKLKEAADEFFGSKGI